MIGNELLDDPRADPIAVGRELRDIARLNAWFGGTGAVVRELEPCFEQNERETGSGKRETWTLLDIGTGAGDIPRAAVAAAARYGITLSPIGVARPEVGGRCDREPGVAPPAARGGGALHPRVRRPGASPGGARGPAPIARRDGRRVGGVPRLAYGSRDPARRGRVAPAGLHEAGIRRHVVGSRRRDAGPLSAGLPHSRRVVTGRQGSVKLTDAKAQAVFSERCQGCTTCVVQLTTACGLAAGDCRVD